jgi:hypothetical protein
VWGPEVREWEERLENFGRNPKLPNARTWDRWSDPKDPGRWVAVLYAGDSWPDKVHHMLKKGF